MVYVVLTAVIVFTVLMLLSHKLVCVCFVWKVSTMFLFRPFSCAVFDV